MGSTVGFRQVEQVFTLEGKVQNVLRAMCSAVTAVVPSRDRHIQGLPVSLSLWLLGSGDGKGEGRLRDVSPLCWLTASGSQNFL